MVQGSQILRMYMTSLGSSHDVSIPIYIIFKYSPLPVIVARENRGDSVRLPQNSAWWECLSIAQIGSEWRNIFNLQL